MVKAFFFSLILLFTIPPVQGQVPVTGKWYMFSRNRIIQFSFSEDSILSKHLGWDLVEMTDRDRADTQLISHTATANGNIYQYMKDTAGRIGLSTFRLLQPDKELLWVLNDAKEPFADTTAAQQYILADTGSKYGITLYSESELLRMKAQKSIAAMTAGDRKKYVEKLIASRYESDSLSHLPDAPDGLLYYLYSRMREIIGQLGYNPLLPGREMDQFFEALENDPVTKEMLDKIADRKE